MKVSHYEVWEFPHGIGADKPYFVPPHPDSRADEPGPSFTKKADAKELLAILEEDHPPSEVLPDLTHRIVKVTYEVV